MEYMLLIYAAGEPGSGSQEDRDRMGAAFARYTQDLDGAGALVGDDRLADPGTATTLRSQGGELIASDGPFAETKEWLAGYYKIEVDSLDEAIEWARKVPSVAHFGSVEIRPLAPTPTGRP